MAEPMKADDVIDGIPNDAPCHNEMVQIINLYMAKWDISNEWQHGWTYKWLYNHMWNGVLAVEADKRMNVIEQNMPWRGGL